MVKTILAVLHLTVTVVTVVSAFSSTTDKNQKKKTLGSSSGGNTLGGLIQEVSTLQQGLEVGNKFWLPTDPNLPSHYINQQVHHDKRQRWASQLLDKISTFPFPSHLIADEFLQQTVSIPSDRIESLLEDHRFTRLILAAALPFRKAGDNVSDSSVEDVRRDTWMLDSLLAVYTIVGRMAVQQPMGRVHLSSLSLLGEKDDEDETSSTTTTIDAIRRLIQYCCFRQASYPLDKAWEIYTAVKGLRARIPCLEATTTWEEEDDEQYELALAGRVSELPFEIVPRGVDFGSLGLDGGNQKRLCNELKKVIPFSKDIIVTRGGESVTERRGTAWVAEEGIGALAYSGKLMAPHTPVPHLVSMIMRNVEDRLELPIPFFDCALCNHYNSADAACKFHTDPEHSTVWHTTTVVVTTGSDRKFSFKPIPGRMDWTVWDKNRIEKKTMITVHQPSTMAATVSVFAGDIVVMKDTCNDDFFHSVHVGVSDEQRISLVLKRAIDRGNGRKGHGLQGSGRRSKKKKTL